MAKAIYTKEDVAWVAMRRNEELDIVTLIVFIDDGYQNPKLT